MDKMRIKYPLPKTLEKYGLTKMDYRMLFESQNGCCAVCGNPMTRRTNIDHQHGIRGWKKLPSERRKQTVRGILCWTCNHLILGRGVTIMRLKKAIEYLEQYENKLSR